jgi:hypothetical protein
MRYWGMKSWQIGVGDAEPFMLFALWLRDVERLPVPAAHEVPGPLDTDQLPPASIDPVLANVLAADWLAWWHTIIDKTERPPVLPPDTTIEPAFDSPDPIGLARLPRLADLATRRWPEHLRWDFERKVDHANRRTVPNPTTGVVVREVEGELGRKLRPFKLQFSLLPVCDERILQIGRSRYLLPERVYDSAEWAAWLHDVVHELG